MRGRHERQVTGLYRRTSGVLALRQRSRFSSLRPTFHTCTAREDVPQEGGQQSKTARTKTKGYTFRFPRPCRLAGRGLPPASNQFGIREALTNDLADCKVETLRIVHVLPVVEAERLLINITEQVIR